MIVGKPDPYAKVPIEAYAEYGRLAIKRDQIEMRMGVLRQQIVNVQRKLEATPSPVSKDKPDLSKPVGA